MLRNLKIMTVGLAALTVVACTMSRVIKQTDTTAVIQGVGPTEFEAKENATKKAEEILGSVQETQKPECNQEMQASGNTTGTGENQTYKSQASTYYSCVMYFSKK